MPQSIRIAKRFSVSLIGEMNPGGAAAEFSAFYQRMVMIHGRMDPQVPAGAAVFLGDSLIQGFYLPAVDPLAVNFGISSDTSSGLCHRLPRYACLSRAAFIFGCIGVNDCKNGIDPDPHLEGILKSLPEVPVIWNGILPIDEAVRPDLQGVNKLIRQTNLRLETICRRRPHLSFLDPTEHFVNASGGLRSDLHNGDGLHLSAEGYQLWARLIRQRIQCRLPDRSRVNQ